ncbi:hypothetical protein [Sphaerimonospora mesophila]|uniref:hypothetical protein n=1 Tax=Sphaerimonospora mesophila TaxID=37483 RepID=UPI0006E2F66A
MSYDLHFVLREPGQSWDDVLETEEETTQRAPADPAVWDRVAAQAREVLGDITVRRDDSEWRLDHEPTGIDLSCWDGEWGLSVPYWTHDDEAADVVEKLRKLALIVERETGLECHDPQLGQPLSEIPISDTASSVTLFNEVAGQFGRR